MQDRFSSGAAILLPYGRKGDIVEIVYRCYSRDALSRNAMLSLNGFWNYRRRNRSNHVDRGRQGGRHPLAS
jgi:hypothetical protein